MAKYRNFSAGDWIVAQIDARTNFRMIIQVDFEDRFDGKLFLRHAMPVDFRNHQVKMPDGDRFCDCARLPSLKYGPGSGKWKPVDYGPGNWTIEGNEILARGMLICTVPPGQDQAAIMHLICHGHDMMKALQAAVKAGGDKTMGAAIRQGRDVLRSMDLLNK
jgi:hypothetical protein